MIMKPYGLNELREMFLRFFETKEHLRLPSFSLIPQDDTKRSVNQTTIGKLLLFQSCRYGFQYPATKRINKKEPQ